MIERTGKECAVLRTKLDAPPSPPPDASCALQPETDSQQAYLQRCAPIVVEKVLVVVVVGSGGDGGGCCCCGWWWWWCGCFLLIGGSGGGGGGVGGGGSGSVGGGSVGGGGGDWYGGDDFAGKEVRRHVHWLDLPSVWASCRALHRHTSSSALP